MSHTEHLFPKSDSVCVMQNVTTNRSGLQIYTQTHTSKQRKQQRSEMHPAIKDMGQYER